MRDRTALWLILTNILLGVLVVAAVLYVLSGPFRDMLSRLKKIRGYEAEVNHDMEEMFPGGPRPGLARRIRTRIHDIWRRIAARRR